MFNIDALDRLYTLWSPDGFVNDYDDWVSTGTYSAKVVLHEPPRVLWGYMNMRPSVTLEAGSRKNRSGRVCCWWASLAYGRVEYHPEHWRGPSTSLKDATRKIRSLDIEEQLEKLKERAYSAGGRHACIYRDKLPWATDLCVEYIEHRLPIGLFHLIGKSEEPGEFFVREINTNGHGYCSRGSKLDSDLVWWGPR